MNTKDQVRSIFVSLMNMVERNLFVKLKEIQTNGRGDVSFLITHLVHLELNHRVSCPYTFEQNGVIELRNRRVVEKRFALLIQVHLSSLCWVHALELLFML